MCRAFTGLPSERLRRSVCAKQAGSGSTSSTGSRPYWARRDRLECRAVMVKCQMLVSEDVLLETVGMDAAPNFGGEVVVGGKAYVVEAPPSDLVKGEATVYVGRVA